MRGAAKRFPKGKCGWGLAVVLLAGGLVPRGWAQEVAAPALGAPPQAAETAAPHAGGATGLLAQLNIKPPLLLVNAVGFLLLWWLLTKFLWQPAGQFLAKRQQIIQNNLEEAERQRTEMQRIREEYERRLADIEQEHRDRIQAAQREAHAARDELLAEARAERDRIVAAGVQEIQREKEKALVEIRDQVVDLAILAAAQVIGRELDEPAHRSLINEVIEGIGRN